MNRWIGARDVSKLLGVCIQTARLRMKAETFGPCVRVGKSNNALLRVEERRVRDWMTSQSVPKDIDVHYLAEHEIADEGIYEVNE